MIFDPTPLHDSYVVKLDPFTDDRGWFVRTYCKNEFEQIRFNGEWVQMNHSYTAKKGTVRGMHFQLPPFREIKLVRCIRGEVFDVIVDIREKSPTFLKWFGIKLSLEEMNMIYIPEGFAHGFQTLTDDCELIYHHSAFYQPGHEGGLRYNDDMLGITWPVEMSSISDRDMNHPSLNNTFKGI